MTMLESELEAAREVHDMIMIKHRDGGCPPTFLAVDQDLYLTMRQYIIKRNALIGVGSKSIVYAQFIVFDGVDIFPKI